MTVDVPHEELHRMGGVVAHVLTVGRLMVVLVDGRLAGVGLSHSDGQVTLSRPAPPRFYARPELRRGRRAMQDR